MDGSRFDAWTRRRFSLATGGLLAALTSDAAWDVAAKRKKRHKQKKRCSKQEKRCQGQCISRSQCCGDSDCSSNAHCCEGACLSLDTPCDSWGCACFAEDGLCRQTVEGDVDCTRTSDLPICAQCASSDGCLLDERCFPAECGKASPPSAARSMRGSEVNRARRDHHAGPAMFDLAAMDYIKPC